MEKASYSQRVADSARFALEEDRKAQKAWAEARAAWAAVAKVAAFWAAIGVMTAGLGGYCLMCAWLWKLLTA